MLQANKLQLALELGNTQPKEPLKTPAQLDQDNKARQAAVKKATVATKRKRAVVTPAAADKAGAVLLELETQEVGPAAPIPTSPAASIPTSPPVQLIHTPAVEATSRLLQEANRVQTTTQIPLPAPTNPPQLKCEGCVHCDLLELKILEPAIVKHYLKPHEFLEKAQCDGDCAQSMHAVYLTSPKASVHYCDVGKKGFDAPNDDPTKVSMECGLVLCHACYGARSQRYALANSREGGRTTRRRRIR